MIWLWIYVAGLLPAMMLATYLLARVDAGHPEAVRAAVREGMTVGAIWPVVIVIAPLLFTLDWLAKRGERDGGGGAA